MSFEVLYDASSRVIIGPGPFDPGTVAPDGYAIAALDDDRLYGFVIYADIATLDGDGLGITSQGGSVPEGDHRVQTPQGS